MPFTESLTLETAIENEVRRTAPPRKRRKPRRPLWVSLLLDAALAGMLLCGFSLQHHVLPTVYQPASPPQEQTPAQPEEQTPAQPEDTSMGAKFADKFTATAILTETGYSGPNVAFTVTEHTQGEGADLVTYYVADIYIRHIECFRTAFAGDAFSKNVSEPILDIASRHNALLAVSGDYYGRGNGPVIRNGELYRDTVGSSDVCVLYRDGTVQTFSKGQFVAETELARGAWQAWCFGPSLLTSDGTAKTDFNSTAYLSGEHPRCALGYYEPGHYALVVVDGRRDGHSRGVTLSELSELMQSLGCTAAYNLDGGRSAQMVMDDDIVNLPYKDGRDISDILYIGEVAAP